ncbi:Cna B-type domain-containing protein, partial [Enterococcus hulanensis]
GNDFEFTLKDDTGKVIDTVKNDGTGAINFNEISYDKAGTYTYTIQETKGNQAGMTYDSHEIKVSVQVEDKDGQLVATPTYSGDTTFKNTYAAEVVTIAGTKTWKDSDNQEGKRPDKITVNLLADGKLAESKEVTAKSEWKYSFTDLPKFKNGKEIVYTITENAVENYKTKIDGFDIENTYEVGKISGTVTKHWEDNNNQAGKRPDSIKIQLYANGKEQGQPVELTEKTKWTYSWEELEAKDQKGQPIQYSIKEVGDVEGYTAKVTGENTGNLLITNTYKETPSNKKGNSGSTSTMGTSGKSYPKTGESKGLVLTILGVIILLIGGYYIYQRKNKGR